MTTVAIVQARMGSSRLPGKVMKKIAGTPMIGLVLERLQKSKNIDEIIVATSTSSADGALADYVRNAGFRCFQGSESDVLSRYFEAARFANAKTVIRITGDCPLIDPNIVDKTISEFERLDVDYLSNVAPPTYPDGLDTEVFSFAALKIAAENATRPEDREHVTLFIRESGLFTTTNVENATDFSHLRWTVDDMRDFRVVSRIVEHFYPNLHFSWEDILDLQSTNPEIFQDNRMITRNEGISMGTGQKLWKRAKEIIPGGNMLLSKRPEMFLPDMWPAYFSKAKGCTVWDLDNKPYIDMSLMGVGTNILGYGNSEVDADVQGTISNGNMSTLNCPEEVALAEKLIDIHPWADMVRLARSGGEANSIAIRIARAASGRDGVAICGYHGWHDWYLSANLAKSKNLDGHLLPGLTPNGVPRNLSDTVFPFEFNDFATLTQLVKDHSIGVIKMEVRRNMPPKEGFLENVRKLASEQGIVLVFDECTSGFRQSFGGLHKIYGVSPDLAVFGKTLGNGYAISAVLGTQDVMQAAQETFISSTFWTERIGPTAALAALRIMERERSWEQITSIGERVGEGWKDLAQSHGLKLTISGLPALLSFSIECENPLAYKTYITQEMLKKGYLATTTFYASITHSEKITDEYFDVINPIFSKLAVCTKGQENILDLLDGPICHAGFKRLN